MAAKENLVHREELEKIKSIWPKIDIPVYHIHGVIDMVSSYKNIYFSKENIRKDLLRVELLDNAGHLLARFNREKIVEIILKLIEED